MMRRSLFVLVGFGLVATGCPTRGTAEHTREPLEASAPSTRVATPDPRPADPEPLAEGNRQRELEESSPVRVVEAGAVDERVYAEHCGELQARECHDLAWTLYEEDGGEATDRVAYSLQRTLCNDGMADACWALGNWLSTSGRREEALLTWFDGCRLGDQTACARAGEYLVYGERAGVRGDPARGIEMLRESCASKDCFGCLTLLGFAQGYEGVFEADPELAEFAETTAGTLPRCLP